MQKTITAESIDRALDIMRQRVDAFGVAEPELARVGSDLIEVSLVAHPMQPRARVHAVET